MRYFPTPIVVVSKCLEFGPVRYNGEAIPDKVVQRLDEFVEFMPVCPEVEIGLGIPRDVIRLVDAENGPRLVQPATEKDLTEKMVRFTRGYLDSLNCVSTRKKKCRSARCWLS